MPDWIKAILVGGLPAVLDTGQAPTQPTVVTATPETIAPVDNTGRDNANAPGNFMMNVTQSQILMTTAAVVGVLGVLYLAKKL